MSTLLSKAVEERITELREYVAGDGVELYEPALAQLRVLAQIPGLMDEAFISVIYDGQIQVEWGGLRAGLEIELHGNGRAHAYVVGVP